MDGIKTFTLEEANRQLPLVEQLLDEMRELREQIVAATSEVQGTIGMAPGNGGSKKAGEYMLLLQRFQATERTFAEIGCELKDLDLGLVDFPSLRDGELVYLCWKRGEPSIKFWHTLDAGFAGRQPL